MSNSKGPSTGGKRKIRKILRDNIEGLTKPALKRLLYRAGVKRISGLVYEELRGVIKVYMEEILKNTVIVTIYSGRKTIQPKDLTAALEIMGIWIGAGLNKNAKTQSLKSAIAKGKTGKKKVIKEKETEDSGKKSKKKAVKEKAHRFKPGTVALRQIRYQQKNSDSLAFPKLSFERLIREICQDYSDDIRLSEGVVELLQLVVENHVINVCANANLIAIATHHQTLYPRDIHIARRIMKTI